MRRREFLALVGGALTLPRTARAQAQMCRRSLMLACRGAYPLWAIADMPFCTAYVCF